MSSTKSIFLRVLPFFRNKFILTLIIFFFWLLFFDRNNLIDRYKEIRKLRQFEKDRVYYTERIEIDSKRLKQLKTSNRNLEKFAREQYFMKKPNEEIFVIIED
ncbi:MAG: septum formation initiator [Bacteroidetes bacterium GWF2_33_16]|nr:MAG: septum formation initiator [Bacteroidetes bacterium GWE2_32_14]OFY08773.1 MAG: septum formation initiator [Bacteroidetes bacterium GWF2_33_16]